MATTKSFSLQNAYTALQTQASSAQKTSTATPSPAAITAALSTIHTSLPSTGLGDVSTHTHILHSLGPGLNQHAQSPNYYGFVTGGVLPIAEAADNIVSAYDQNVQVLHAQESVSIYVEDAALRMLLQLLGFAEESFKGRTFTTGATASNVLGLACGREGIIARRLGQRGVKGGVGELGLLGACRAAGVEEIKVLTTMGHSSLSKAASIVGLGRQSVVDVGSRDTPWRFDMEKLESCLQQPDTACIVAVSCGEVNTGRYATSDLKEMESLRRLCDQYSAWLHVDGAFGLFSRALPQNDEFQVLHDACAGVELADSIAGDAHKCLNVPYDCGFFFTRATDPLTATCQNPNAAYLSSGGSSDVVSPLNINLENSRRFRALPVYAVLLSHGQDGLMDLFARQVRLARKIAAWLDASTLFVLLPDPSSLFDVRDTGIIVLFRAADPEANTTLVDKINKQLTMFVSGTSWKGRTACRMAISTWRVDVDRDLGVITDVLQRAVQQTC